ncbi:putative protein tag-278 [Girardinichthys multiradiatus]|uniref:putative protein tag-278 n=1 Tax=Girardinichthys multiradiatus TaxID=208333 RepID=UPI001FAB59AC|nr:putative protein tag-278 [Girardinichthys multiradiatus]
MAAQRKRTKLHLNQSGAISADVLQTDLPTFNGEKLSTFQNNQVSRKTTEGQSVTQTSETDTQACQTRGRTEKVGNDTEPSVRPRKCSRKRKWIETDPSADNFQKHSNDKISSTFTVSYLPRNIDLSEFDLIQPDGEKPSTSQNYQAHRKVTRQRKNVAMTSLGEHLGFNQESETQTQANGYSRQTQQTGKRFESDSEPTVRPHKQYRTKKYNCQSSGGYFQNNSNKRRDNFYKHSTTDQHNTHVSPQYSYNGDEWDNSEYYPHENFNPVSITQNQELPQEFQDDMNPLLNENHMLWSILEENNILLKQEKKKRIAAEKAYDTCNEELKLHYEEAKRFLEFIDQQQNAEEATQEELENLNTENKELLRRLAFFENQQGAKAEIQLELENLKKENKQLLGRLAFFENQQEGKAKIHLEVKNLKKENKELLGKLGEEQLKTAKLKKHVDSALSSTNHLLAVAQSEQQKRIEAEKKCNNLFEQLKHYQDQQVCEESEQIHTSLLVCDPEIFENAFKINKEESDSQYEKVPEAPVCDSESDTEQSDSESEWVPEAPICDSESDTEQSDSEYETVPEAPICDSDSDTEQPDSESETVPKSPVCDSERKREQSKSESETVPEAPICDSESDTEQSDSEYETVPEAPICDSDSDTEQPNSESETVPKSPVCDSERKIEQSHSESETVSVAPVCDSEIITEDPVSRSQIVEASKNHQGEVNIKISEAACKCSRDDQQEGAGRKVEAIVRSDRSSPQKDKSI